MPTRDDANQPPRDLEAEAAVLGAMLLDPDALRQALTSLDTGDFYNPTHRTIFDACATLEAAGRPVDAVTVAARLAADGTLEDAGGATYLHVLLNSVPTVSQAVAYIELVAQAAHTRRLIDAGHRIAQLGQETGLDAEKAHQIALELLTQVGNARPHALVGDRRLQEAPMFIFDPSADLPAIWGDGREIAWASGESLMIVGPQGVGKSTLAQRLALARIGVGPAELLGMPVAPTASRVLYLACDRPGQIARSMRRMVTTDDRATLAERLMVWRGPPPVDLAKEPRALLTLARNAGADTVVIDSLKDAALDLVKDEVGARYNQARQICLTEGIDLLENHHQRKAAADNKRPRKLDDVYGSNWLTAGAGSILLLWGEPGDPIVELTHLKQPIEEVGPMRLLHDADTGAISVQQSVDLLTLLRTQPGLTAADAARLLFDVEGRSPEPKEVEKARRRLDSLVRRGLAKLQPGSRGRGAGGINPATYHPVVHLEGL